MTFFVGLTGPVRDADAALLPATDSAVTHGDGIFETILLRGGRPIDLPEHLVRLRLSAGILEIDIPPDEAWHAPIERLAAAWAEHRPDEPEAVLRLTVTRSGAMFATAGSVPKRTIEARAGISVILAADPFNRRAPYLTSVAKSLSYAPNLAALRHARARGADDVIFLADDGTISEAPTSAVLIARDGQLLTPPPGPETGILPSITARRLHPVYRRITAQDLHAADAVFLVSAIRLAAPVVAIDGASRPHDAELTAQIQHALAACD